MPLYHEKKHRLPRECYQGLVTVSFTACIVDRKTPFTDRFVFDQFLENLQGCLTKNHCGAIIYCFMPDHLHVLVSGQSAGADTWRAMVDFKQKTGFWLSQHQPQFEWQKDFHDHVIRANEDLGAHVRYVAANPVRRGLAADWRDYPYIGAIGYDLKVVLADTTTL